MRTRGDVVTAGAVSVLLVLSGVATIAAAAERWWPACPFGGFEARECLLLQDHLYDQVIPSVPWEPTGIAAELHALSLVLLATAFTGVALLVAGPGPRRRVHAAIYVAHASVVASLLLLAAATWASGRADRVVLEAPYVAVLGWAFGWPMVMMLAAIGEGMRRGPRRWLVVLLVVLMLASPLMQLMLAPAIIGYLSHDTVPWSEAVAGVMLVLAGLVAAWGAARTGGPRTAPYRRAGDVDPLVSSER